MNEHDKFCTTHELGFCECDDIAAIRADEREQAAQRVEALDPSGEFDPRPWVQELTWWVEQSVAAAAARGEQP